VSDGIHVIKLGGSLLDLPDVVTRFERFCATLTSERLVLIVGGGRAAETVRFFDQHVGFDETTGHWLAIRAMQLNAHLLAQALNAARLVESLDACEEAWKARTVAVVDPLPWLIEAENAGNGVPHVWAFTSDSIAAHAATWLQAARLTLAKSVLPDWPCTIQRAANEGIVDLCLPDNAAAVPAVDIINLRDNAMPRCALR